MTRHPVLLLAAAGFGFAVLSPRISTSQETRRIVVTPYAGFFMPVAKIGKLEGGSTNPGLGVAQQNALALGMNASYWFNNRTGIEVGGFYAFSDMKTFAGLAGGLPGLATPTENAYVIAGSAKFMVNLLPLSDRTALRLGVGPAIIHRDGTAYDPTGQGVLSGLTDVGGAISLCTRLPLTDLLSIRVRAEDYIYQSQLRYVGSIPARDMEFDAKLQHDFVFSAGLQMVFWR
jgi:hypothetical protein